MKCHIRCLLLSLAVFTCLFAFASCEVAAPSGGQQAAVPTDPRIPQMSEPEMSTPLSESEEAMTPAQIKSIADPLLMQEYGMDDLSSYEFKVFYSTRNNQYSARYCLYIQGYRTYEEYTVVLDALGQPVRFSAVRQGEYSRYLKNATAERVAAAVADIEWQTRDYEETGPYSLSVDDEGYLCLWLELIVDVPDGISGDCGDHDHLFFHSRICEADN